MDIEKELAALKRRAAEAEKRSTELEKQLTAARANAQNASLYDALRAAGVAPTAVKHAAQMIRADAVHLDFHEDGSLEFASFSGGVFRDAAKLAQAFVAQNPTFASSGGSAPSSAPIPPEKFENMRADELAALGLDAYLRQSPAERAKASGQTSAAVDSNPLVAAMAAELEKVTR